MFIHTTHKTYGEVTVLNGDKAIGAHIVAGLDWEPHILAELDRILPTIRGCCVDIGAHVGLHALYMAKKHSKFVIAIEPQSVLYSILVNNIVTNEASILPMNFLVSNRTGELWMGIPKSYDTFANPGGLGVVEEHFEHPELLKRNVSCNRLDDIHLNTVGFLKIDVEGHEMEVLEGARQILARDQPTIIIELFGGCDRNEYAQQIADRIRIIEKEYGYILSYIGGCDYVGLPITV
jgi:FkbM family methyltransferase